MNVPLLDLKLQYQTIKKEVEPKLLEIAESQMLILGKEVAQLEKDLAEYCGAPCRRSIKRNRRSADRLNGFGNQSR